MLESIHGYFAHTYPPKDLVDLECLRTLTVGIRNLLMTHKNLQPMLESELLELLVKVFEEHIDREMTRNVADIFGSLTRVGLDFADLVQAAETHLDRENY